MAMQRGLRRVGSAAFLITVTVAFRLDGRYHKVPVYAASIANSGAGLREFSD
jgi:hypothetical protein